MQNTYYKTQLDIAIALKVLVDKYWDMNLIESDFIKDVKKLAEANMELIFKENEYTSVLKQRLGTKRLALLDKILDRGPEKCLSLHLSGEKQGEDE